MKPYSIGFVDDDAVFLEDVRQFLQSVFQKEEKTIELFAYSSPYDFLWDLQEERCICDVYILDVKMPGKNGFELAEEIRKTSLEVSILFLTDFQNEAIHGYAVNARYYVLKEGCKERLSRILLDLYREWEEGNRKYYVYHYSGSMRAVALRDIAYLQFDKAANQLMIATGTEILRERKSLKEALSELQSEDFALVAKGCAVNLTYVERLEGEWVILKTKKTFSLTRKYRKEFIEKLQDYFGRMP